LNVSYQTTSNAMSSFSICAGQEYFLPVFGGDLQQFFKPPFFLKYHHFVQFLLNLP
jgi:hypothetical protein